METESKHTEIMVKLGELVAGQTATNQHLTQLNGKVATQEGRLNHMDIEDGKLSEVIKALQNVQNKEDMIKNKWIERVIGLAVNAIVFLAVLLLVRSGILNLEEKPQSLEEVQKKQIELSAEAQKLYLETTQK